MTFVAPDAGGLYVARRGDVSVTLILPPHGHGLHSISWSPRIDGRARTPEAVQGLLSLIRLWAGARLTGNAFSAIRQRQVLHALIRHLFLVLGGETWHAAEVTLSDGDEGLRALKRAIAAKPAEIGFAAAVDGRRTEIAALPCAERARKLAEVCSRFNVIDVVTETSMPRAGGVLLRRRDGGGEQLCELALRLASSPATAMDGRGAQIADVVARLLSTPLVARAARFLVLATDAQGSRSGLSGPLYPSWDWQ
jgi:hypothetical protein